MTMRRLLNNISTKTLRRICAAVIVVTAVGGAEVWNWTYASTLFVGSAHLAYWFETDGSNTNVLEVAHKNWGSAPVREIQCYGGSNLGEVEMTWYDEHGAPLEWKSEPTSNAPVMRNVAQLHQPVFPGDWVRYTIWSKQVRPSTIEHDGLQWGVFQDTDGNWVFRNNPGLGGENTVAMMLPQGAEVVSAEPANRASIIKCQSPVVKFTNLKGPHVVKWRIAPENPPAKN